MRHVNLENYEGVRNVERCADRHLLRGRTFVVKILRGLCWIGRELNTLSRREHKNILFQLGIKLLLHLIVGLADRSHRK